jgi:hypothetical protein
MNETHPEKRLIGYARVSTYGQTLDSQLEQSRNHSKRHRVFAAARRRAYASRLFLSLRSSV